MEFKGWSLCQNVLNKDDASDEKRYVSTETSTYYFRLLRDPVKYSSYHFTWRPAGTLGNKVATLWISDEPVTFFSRKVPPPVPESTDS